jgi:hypothetical protein
MDEEERENLKNEKLLKRLYKAADHEHRQAVRFENVAEGGDRVMDDQNRALIQQAVEGRHKISHEEWIRCKEHQQSLREVLIQEAKRDLYEKLVRKQAELDQRNQDRA